MTYSMGRPVTAKPIHPNNAYLCRQELDKWDPFTDTFIPVTGATITVTIATDAAGTVPVPALDMLPLAEVGPSSPGMYAAVISGVLCANLVPYIGQTVYQVVRNSVANEVVAVTPLFVQYPRYAQ